MGNAKDKKHLLALVIVFCIAILLRFWQLGAVPAGFDADEAAYGYNAYSLLKTGTDEYGKFLPIALKSFGEYKPALYAYLTIPAIAVFDVTPFAVRFPSALFGSVTVIALYLFAAKLLQDKKTALIASGLLAISPWHLNLSRTTSEVVIALFFIIMMAYAMLRTDEEKRTNRKWVFISLVCGLLAILSYTAAIFFVFIVTLLLVGYSIKKAGKKYSFSPSIALLLGIFFFAGLGYSMIGSINRFEQVNIFQHPATQLLLEEQIREDQFTRPLITRFFHNKMFNMVRTFLHNYNDYVTLDYLVLNGGYPYRERIPSTGLFYIWEIPVLLFGIYVLIKKSQKTGLLLVTWWLLLLVPAAITFDEIPNVYRSLIVLPAMVVIIAVGLWEVSRFHKYLAMAVLGILVIFGTWEMLYYEHQYFVYQ